MRERDENDLNESVLLMEKKLVKKMFLANNKSESERHIYKSDLANEKLHFQYKGKEEMDKELNLTHKELAFLHEERAKRAAELVIANKELLFQKKEKAERAVELVIANRELDFQKLEININQSELLIATKKLIFKTQERQIKAAELNIANRDLLKLEEKQREYIKGLEEMMFMTSHRVRQPIINILRLSNVLDQLLDLPEELAQTVAYIREAAFDLDIFTRELTDSIHKLGKNEENKSAN